MDGEKSRFDTLGNQEPYRRIVRESRPSKNTSSGIVGATRIYTTAVI